MISQIKKKISKIQKCIFSIHFSGKYRAEKNVVEYNKNKLKKKII